MAQIYDGHKLDEHIDVLRKIANHSNLINNKHGACLLKGNKMHSIGYNKYIRTDVINDQTVRFTIHAEIDALCKIDNKYTKGMDILIIRIGNAKTQKLRNSRPCNACIDKLIQRGIRKVYYSNQDGNIVFEFLHDMKKLHISSGYSMRWAKT
jgi:deoxycytidylate deaminase